MKAFIFAALVMILGAQFAQAESVSECNQGAGSEIRIIREIR